MGRGALQPHCPTASSPLSYLSRPFSKISLQLLEHFRHWNGSKVCLDPSLLQGSVSISSSSRLFPPGLSSVLSRRAASSRCPGRAHAGDDHTQALPRKSLPALSHFQLCRDQPWLDPLPSCSQTPLPSALISALSPGLQMGQGLSLFTGTSGSSKKARRQPPFCCTGALMPRREQDPGRGRLGTSPSQEDLQCLKATTKYRIRPMAWNAFPVQIPF